LEGIVNLLRVGSADFLQAFSSKS